MHRSLYLPLTLLLPLVLFAQLVPLELDQTITLPDTSGVWDVMPHPDGYNVWVQAVRVDTLRTKILWGRLGAAAYDSVEVNGGIPHSITGYWGPNHQARIVLSGWRPVFRSYIGWTYGLHCRAFSLSTGDFCTSDWQWSPSATNDMINVSLDSELRTVGVFPCPMPPQISETCALVIGHIYRWSGGHVTGQGTIAEMRSNMVGDIFRDTESVAMNPGCYASLITCGEGAHFAAIGSFENVSQMYGYPPNYYRTAPLRTVQVGPGGLAIDTLMRCVCGGECGCPSYPLVATHSMTDAEDIVFSRFENGFSAISTSSSPNTLWRMPCAYSSWFAAEVVPGNDTEEFLAYDWTAQKFSVLDARTGQWYGMTSELASDVAATARLIGRFDSTSRRMATREGNTLKLYRFGEYLAAGERRAPLPGELTLSAYPNPFNPTTTLAFSLAQPGLATLAVFDVTGREVFRRDLGPLPAGAHTTRFDGQNLASGLYFARLEAGNARLTTKLLLVR